MPEDGETGAGLSPVVLGGGLELLTCSTLQLPRSPPYTATPPCLTLPDRPRAVLLNRSEQVMTPVHNSVDNVHNF